GEPIPPNWIVDGNGRPTTDASGFPHTGALLPMAGHKGYGLSLLIETLSGILSGAAVTWGVRSWSYDDAALPTLHGAAFLAIDVSCIAPVQEFARKVEAVIEEVHNSPRAEGVDRLLVPGELEWERYDVAVEKGILLPSDVVANLQQASETVGLE